MVNKMVNHILKIENEGEDSKLSKYILDYLKNNNINPQELYNYLSNNQNNSDSIFLLGYFNYLGIKTSKDRKKSFNLFRDASKQNHVLAQYYVGLCYEFGHGTDKNEKLAFEYYEKVSDK